MKQSIIYTDLHNHVSITTIMGNYFLLPSQPEPKSQPNEAPPNNTITVEPDSNSVPRPRFDELYDGEFDEDESDELDGDDEDLNAAAGGRGGGWKKWFVSITTIMGNCFLLPSQPEHKSQPNEAPPNNTITIEPDSNSVPRPRLDELYDDFDEDEDESDELDSDDEDLNSERFKIKTLDFDDRGVAAPVVVVKDAAAGGRGGGRKKWF